MFGEAFGEFNGSLVTGVRGQRARRAEDCDGGTDLREDLERIHKLRHDAKDAPGVFLDEGDFVVVHAGRSLGLAVAGLKAEICQHRAAGRWSKIAKIFTVSLPTFTLCMRKK